MSSSNTSMLMTSIHAAILFSIVSSPLVYSLTQKAFGRFFQVAYSNGAPTLSGLLLHTVVFCLVTYATMWMHKKMGWSTCTCRKEGYMYDMEDDDMSDMEYDDMESDNDNDLYDKSMDMFEDDFEDDDFEDDDFEDDDTEDDYEDDIEIVKSFFTGD